MSAFQDQVRADLTGIFVNPDEFGETVEINGVPVLAVLDDDQLNYRVRNTYQGLLIGDALFYITEEEWKKVPRVSKPPRADEAIRINGKPATITLVSTDMGLHEIKLSYTGGKLHG